MLLKQSWISEACGTWWWWGGGLFQQKTWLAMWHDTKDSPCYRELYKTHSSRIHIRNACLHLMHDTPQSTCRHVCSGTIDSERAGAGVITITSQKRQKSIQLGTFSTNSSFLVPALCSAQLTAENSPPENETDAKNKKSQKHKKKKQKQVAVYFTHPTDASCSKSGPFIFFSLTDTS